MNTNNVTMINTANGKLTPDAALDRFINGRLNEGAQLGILKQLAAHPDQMAAAKRHVNANLNHFSKKVQDFVNDASKSGGKPQRVAIRSQADLDGFLDTCPPVTRVRVTFKRSKARRLMAVSHIPGLVFDDKLGMWAVSDSGEWHFISPTFVATLTLPSNGDRSALYALIGIVESIELIP